MALAQKLDGVIINADSMQVYRELRVLTARPAAEDEAAVPHKLYGHVAGADAYSTGRYARDAATAIAEAQADKRVPIIVGGTGLYFRALLEGLSPIPPVPDDIRAHWRGLEQAHGAYALWTVLMHDDPQMALRLDPNDGQRIVRALEVFHSTGKSLAEWQRAPGLPVLEQAGTVRLVVLPERDELRQRCDVRFDAMMEQGAMDEVRMLAALNLPTDLPVMRALGVAPLMQLMEGKVTMDEAVTQAKAETRQYVKRQTTWLRRNMSAWKHIFQQQMKSIDEIIVAFIDC
jgi:tRNA dimethylallyltransferase